jgi:hypothetical protein
LGTTVSWATVNAGGNLEVVNMNAGYENSIFLLKFIADNTSGSHSIQGFFNITQISNNLPVNSTAFTDQIAIAGSPQFTYDVSGVFTDADGDIITLTSEDSLTPGSLPSWITFDGSIFTISPTVVADIILNLIATDSQGGSTTVQFNVTITNASPVGSTVSGISQINNTAISHAIDLSPLFTDPEVTMGYQALSFSISNVPAFLTTTWSGSVITFSGTSTAGDVGVHSIDLVASDGFTTTSIYFVVIITLNTPPYANTVQNIQTYENQLTTFDMNAFGFVDDESDSITYTMEFANGTGLTGFSWISFDSVTMQLQVTPPSTAASPIALVIYADDSFNPLTSIFFDINVDFIPKVNAAVTQKSGVFYGNFNI